MIRETRLRVASNPARGWQANKKTHLCVASGIRAMPEKEKPPAMRVDDYFMLPVMQIHEMPLVSLYATYAVDVGCYSIQYNSGRFELIFLLM